MDTGPRLHDGALPAKHAHSADAIRQRDDVPRHQTVQLPGERLHGGLHGVDSCRLRLRRFWRKYSCT